MHLIKRISIQCWLRYFHAMFFMSIFNSFISLVKDLDPLLNDKIRQCRNLTARSFSICSRSSYNWYDSTPVTSRVRYGTIYNMRHVHGLVGMPLLPLVRLYRDIYFHSPSTDPWITRRSYTLSYRWRMNWGRIY